MTKKEAKLADAMRKNIENLTALQDVQKINAAAEWWESEALENVRAKYASQLETVKKFEKMAGSREAYDEMRAEVGAVGAGQEDPLTSEFLTQRLNEIKQKMNYYKNNTLANITSLRERGSLALEGLGELGFDAANQTREAGAASYEWATRRKGDTADFEVLEDTLEGGAWTEGQCVACFGTRNVKNGLCKIHRKMARTERGTCYACGESCESETYMHEDCKHRPAFISYDMAQKRKAASSQPEAAAIKASSSSDVFRHRCNICWGRQGDLEQVLGGLWYHSSCLQKWEYDWTRVREGEPLPRKSIPRGYVPKDVFLHSAYLKKAKEKKRT